MKYCQLTRAAAAPLLSILVMLLSSDSASPMVNHVRKTRAVKVDNSVLRLEDLSHDPALNQVVPLRFDEARLDDVLKALTEQRHLKLIVSSDLAPRKITARCKYAPIASFMTALSHVLGVSWRKSSDSYYLFQTAEQIAMERRKKRDSEAREQRYVKAQSDKLRAQVESALRQTGTDRNPFADFLAGCDADTIDRGITSCLEDEPIISATDQSHFYNHFLAVKPFSNLPSVQQAGLRRIAREGGYSHLDNNSSVGLIAAAGGFRLGIVEPDGKDVWVAPRHPIGQVGTITQTTREDDFDPGVVAQLRSNRLVEFGAIAGTLQHKRPKIDKTVDQSHLASRLQDITAQADVDFLCDCYLNSAQTTHLYDADPSWTAEIALTWIARTFGHQMKYRGGLLEITTVTPGLDLRLESPTAVMNSLDAQVISGHLPNREDLLVLSLCSQEQLQILLLRHPVVRKTRTGHLLQALRSFPFLQFYGSLSPIQKRAALSAHGANVRDLSTAQLRLFETLLTVGVPRKPPAKYNLERNHFYLKFSVFNLHDVRREVITFIATTPENAASCRMAGL